MNKSYGARFGAGLAARYLSLPCALLAAALSIGCAADSSNSAIDSNSNWAQCKLTGDCRDGYECVARSCTPIDATTSEVADSGARTQLDGSAGTTVDGSQGTTGDLDASGEVEPAPRAADADAAEPPTDEPVASAASSLVPDGSTPDASSPALSTPLPAEAGSLVDTGPSADAGFDPGPLVQAAIQTNAINCCDYFRLTQRSANAEHELCIYLDIRAEVGAAPDVTAVRALPSATDCLDRYAEATPIEQTHTGTVDITFADGGILLDLQLLFDTPNPPEWMPQPLSVSVSGLPIDGQWRAP